MWKVVNWEVVSPPNKEIPSFGPICIVATLRRILAYLTNDWYKDEIDSADFDQYLVSLSLTTGALDFLLPIDITLKDI